MKNELAGRRILFDGHVLDGSPQGTTSYIQGMATELSSNNEVFVACKHESSLKKFFGSDKNVRWVPLKSSNKYVRLAFELPALCKKYEIDYAYFQYVAPLRKNTKWIVCVNDVLFLDYPKYFPWRYIISKAILYYVSALRADILVTCSDYSRRRIERWFRLKENSIGVTYPAIVSSKYADSAEISDLLGKRFFLYVSRVEPRKNHVSLINALDQLTDYSDVLLVFAGHTTIEVERLNELIDRRKLGGRIRFITPSDDQLCWLYRNCSASFYPSLCEGFGIPILEAKLCGAFSFCASNTAMLDLDPYVDGMFDADDTAEIVKLMRLVLTKQIQPVNSGRSIIENFSWSMSAKQLRD